MPGERRPYKYKCATEGCETTVKATKGILHRYCRACRIKKGMYLKHAPVIY